MVWYVAGGHNHKSNWTTAAMVMLLWLLHGGVYMGHFLKQPLNPCRYRVLSHWARIAFLASGKALQQQGCNG
jgi:hypothetical protein